MNFKGKKRKKARGIRRLRIRLLLLKRDYVAKEN